MPVSMPSAHQSVPARPVPRYADEAVRSLSERLEDARTRKLRLREAGIPVDHLDREILELRRQLREGGQLRAGDTLGDGRYLLLDPVGRGGFAVVWEAYDHQRQQRVAIKVLHSNLAGDQLRRERFFRGARAMMKLTHTAVVHVLEPEEADGGFHYFVMEFVSGGNLRAAVLEGRLERARILPLILRVSETVAEAHAKGMIHRDIKPSNILLDHEGNPKLTDFDLVGAPDTTGGTRTGALGTLLYAAPECLDRPQDATPRADVYGLGMTAIFCLSGQEISLSTLRNPDPTIAKLDCSLPIKALLRRAVAWEPADRFETAAAMSDALREELSPPSTVDHADLHDEPEDHPAAGAVDNPSAVPQEEPHVADLVEKQSPNVDNHPEAPREERSIADLVVPKSGRWPPAPRQSYARWILGIVGLALVVGIIAIVFAIVFTMTSKNEDPINNEDSLKEDLAKFEDFRRAMCACNDMICVSKIETDMNDYSNSSKGRKIAFNRLSDAEQGSIAALAIKISECRRKVMESTVEDSKASPPPPTGDMEKISSNTRISLTRPAAAMRSDLQMRRAPPLRV